jgi:hypothetical protein
MRKRTLIGLAAALAAMIATVDLAQVSFPNPGVPQTPTSRTGPRWYEPSARTGVAIEAAINAAYKNGGRVFLPGGTYLVGRTIDLTHIGPIIIEGEAMATFDGWRGNGGVMLNWTGEPGGTMLRMNALGVQMRNITLNGQKSAGIGVNLVSPVGWGSALDRFEYVGFANFKTAGVQAGAAPSDPNAADMFFDYCWFSGSGTGFKVVNDQGLNYQFNACSFGDLDVAIHVERGGAVHVQGGGGAGCDTFLRTGGGGSNTGPITIRDFRFENSGRNVMWSRFIDAPDSAGGTQVILDGVRLAHGVSKGNNAQTETFRIGANVTVHVRDSYLQRPGNWPYARLDGKPGYPAVLHIQSSNLGGDTIPPDAIVKNADAKLKITSAFD